MTETPTEAPAQVAPAETWTIAELRAHFHQHHQVPWDSSKWSKDKQQRWHMLQHQDAGTPGKDTGYRMTPHVHQAIEPTVDQAEALAHIREGKLPNKVLSGTERKNLTELVNNDFASLKAQTKRFAAEAQAAEETALNEEWADKASKVDSWVERAHKLAAKQREESTRLVERQREESTKLTEAAKEVGVTLMLGALPKGSVSGLDAALAEVKGRYDRNLTSALNAMESQRLGCLRTILMAGVSPEGLTLLQSIPSAQEAMLAAAGGPKQVEA